MENEEMEIMQTEPKTNNPVSPSEQAPEAVTVSETSFQPREELLVILDALLGVNTNDG